MEDKMHYVNLVKVIMIIHRLNSLKRTSLVTLYILRFLFSVECIHTVTLVMPPSYLQDLQIPNQIPMMLSFQIFTTRLGGMILSSLIYSLANELRSRDQGLMLNCSNHSWTGQPPNNSPFISELFEEQNLSTVNQMIGQTFSLSDSIYRVSFNTFKFRQKLWPYLPSVALPS